VSARISDETLFDLDARVRHALKTGDESGLNVSGYGEVTTVLLVETPEGRVACKRLPQTDTRDAPDHWVTMIGRYVEALGDAGLTVVDNEIRVLEIPGDAFVTYSIQPALDPATLGPNYFATLDAEEAKREFVRILELIKKTVSPTLAPDGQLSNWAFVDGQILYIDVSSPFMKDEGGNNLLDWTHYVRSMPAPVRPLILKFVIPGVIDKYHTLRGQYIDLLGNLRKEKLDRFVPDFLPLANERLRGVAEPITEAEITAYYRDDARTYAALQAVRGADRWFQRNILRRTYPFLLQPKIERNL